MLQLIAVIEKGRLFEPLARLFEPEEIIFQFSAENKAIFNNKRKHEIPDEDHDNHTTLCHFLAAGIKDSILMHKYILPADPTFSTLVLLQHLNVLFSFERNLWNELEKRLIFF